MPSGYADMVDIRRSRRVPDDKREFFKEPFGIPIEENDLQKINGKLITVGDVVSLTVVRNGIIPDIAIYDGMTERREMTGFASYVEDKGWIPVTVTNSAGTMTAELMDAVKNALTGSERIVIRVIGEEDLATVPCILLSPMGTNIIYGWPGKGMMLITTDESIKKRTEELFEITEEFQ
jgi:uncharacterized protein (UPF0218 family)